MKASSGANGTVSALRFRIYTTVNRNCRVIRRALDFCFIWSICNENKVVVNSGGGATAGFAILGYYIPSPVGLRYMSEHPP
jgi:hypothetical protein